MTDLKNNTIEELCKQAYIGANRNDWVIVLDSFDELVRRLRLGEKQQRNEVHDAEVAAKALNDMADRLSEMEKPEAARSVLAMSVKYRAKAKRLNAIGEAE